MNLQKIFNKYFYNFDLLILLFISIIYAIYFYIIGGASPNDQSLINFVRNDTFLYDDCAKILLQAISNKDYSILEKYDYIYYLFPNVILQTITYSVFNNLWGYWFVNIFFIFIIFKITVAIYLKFCSENVLFFKIICLLLYSFFPSIIFSFIILGKDIFIILFSLILLYFLVKNEKINISEIIILIITIFFYINIRPSFLIIILIIFTTSVLYILFFYKNNNKLILNRFNLIFLISLILLITKFYFFNFLGFSGDFSHFYALTQFDNYQTTDIKLSRHLPYFINKILIYLHDVRTFFMEFQLRINSNTAIISQINYSYSHEIALIIFLKSFYISVYPFFFNVIYSDDILSFFIHFESLFIILFLSLIFLDKKNFKLKLLIFFLSSCFISMIVFCYPNIGTIIRYKVLSIPFLIIFSLSSFSNILAQYNKFDICDKLIKRIEPNTLIFLIFFCLSIIFIAIRDLFFIYNLNLQDQKILIFILSLLTIFISTNNNAIIDTKANNSNLLINIFASLIALLVLLFIQLIFKTNIDIREFSLIYLIILSALFNSNTLSNLLTSKNKNLFYLMFLTLNGFAVFIIYNFQISIINILYCILIPSVILNVIFYNSKNILKNINFNIKRKSIIYLNQILVTIIFLVLIYFSYDLNKYSQLNSYFIKLFLSLSFTGVLISRMIYLINNNETSLKDLDIIFKRFNYYILPISILIIIFCIFLLVFSKIVGLINLTENSELILMSFLFITFLNNFSFQKMIIYEKYQRLILIINTLILIFLLFSKDSFLFTNYINYFLTIIILLSILPISISISHLLSSKKNILIFYQFFIFSSFFITSLIFIYY